MISEFIIVKIMKEKLIMRVSPETLGNLLDALVDVTSEMRSAEPDQDERFGDEFYKTCLCMENAVLGIIRQRELKRQEGKEIAG